jgi:NAD(P)-dependent dehydrogenase (short-subunit alcohol dehydrogenase family)
LSISHRLIAVPINQINVHIFRVRSRADQDPREAGQQTGAQEIQSDAGIVRWLHHPSALIQTHNNRSMNNETAYNGKIAVITGAAGGMGAAVAARLAGAGWPLLLCDLDAGRLQPMAAKFSAAGHSAQVLAGDIADPAYPARLTGALAARDIGILIHTAGLSPTMADAERILKVNFDATAKLVEVARPRMAKGGCAVLIASSAAHMVKSDEWDRALTEAIAARSSAALLPLATRPEMAYPLSKRAVIRLVAHEATAFGARGARIVSISPGLIDTAMTRAEQTASAQMRSLLARTPLARLGTADEIASAAVFLCSKDASYITGCDLRVDGGTLASLGL